MPDSIERLEKKMPRQVARKEERCDDYSVYYMMLAGGEHRGERGLCGLQGSAEHGGETGEKDDAAGRGVPLGALSG